MRELLDVAAYGESEEVPHGSDKMGELRLSLERVSGELFWRDYLSQVADMEVSVLAKWRAGEVPEAVAKSVTGLLEALRKMEATVEMRLREVDSKQQQQLTIERWRNRGRDERQTRVHSRGGGGV